MRTPKKQNKKIILGLTGGVGSGKTTVARMFKSLGARIIDADKISRGLLRPKTGVYRSVVKFFGRGILKKSLTVNRRELGRIIFGNQKLRKKLNQLMHPEIKRIIRKELKNIRKGLVVLEAPLLFESGIAKLVDKIIVVSARQPNALNRLLKKTHLTKDEILKRIKSQMALKEKVRRADFVIDNNATLAKTKKQVIQIRRLLWKSWISGI